MSAHRVGSETERVCTRCFNLWPRTTEYFEEIRRIRNGREDAWMSSWCRACHNEQVKTHAQRKAASR